MLRECDVVLYDRLVHPDVIGLARQDAELIYVGKHQGEQEVRQEEIFDLILDRARKGKTVGRLKGGDSLVFGRGAEEWHLALTHGIRVELVPGITSAIAVPGLAGIPLTFRNMSQGFAVVTGHCHEGTSHAWERYAHVDTLVILMGVKNRQLIASSLVKAGRSPNQPVAFVYRGSLKEESTVESTLADVAAGKVEVKNPSVFVIGDVVNLRRLLNPPA
jgi:uroporphyrin-III C-methyltransferase